jgi:hypothetical protein
VPDCRCPSNAKYTFWIAAVFWHCEPAFHDLCNSGFFTEVINYELSHFHNHAHHFPEAATESEMLICRSERFNLVVKVLTGTEEIAPLFALPEHHMITLIGGDSVKLELYHQPQPWPNDILDCNRRLVLSGSRILKSGDVALFRAGTDVFSVEVPPNTFRVMAFLTSDIKLRLRWEYDRRTLAPIRLIAADRVASRLEFTAWMLAELGNAASIPVLVSLLEHEDHFVRWAAYRAIFRLDRDAGQTLLRTALHDKHEHIRNAARRSLKLVGQPVAQRDADLMGKHGREN